MNTQLAIGTFGEVTSVTEIPSTGILWEMPAAPIWCDSCWCETVPVPSIEDEEDPWILPCHMVYADCHSGYVDLTETSSCENCECCSDCCDCWWCESCEQMTSPHNICGNCGRCSSCCECHWCQHGYGSHKVSGARFCGDCERCFDHCSCARGCDCGDPDCPENGNRGTFSSSAVMPGWRIRGDAMPSERGDATELLRDHLRNVDPVQSMADFYLLDWILAVVMLKGSGAGSVSLYNAGGRSLALIRNAAQTLQKWHVQQCDSAFRDYVLCAIGGEIRHHRNVREDGGFPAARESAWDYWCAMAESIGREQIISDAVALFGCRSWSASFGGRKWQICAEVLLSRENGSLDARTFVDRCFSLQHNGGSLLNKSAWVRRNVQGYATGHMVRLGEAHHNGDLETLAECASDDVLSLLRSLFLHCSYVLSDDQREQCERALRIERGEDFLYQQEEDDMI